MNMEQKHFEKPSQLTELVLRLERIAKKNRDEFCYNIEVEPKLSGRLQYRFVCNEKAEDHGFVGGEGDTLEAAVEAATAEIEEACEIWGYKPVQ
jgi:hypothetical protein